MESLSRNRSIELLIQIYYSYTYIINDFKMRNRRQALSETSPLLTENKSLKRRKAYKKQPSSHYCIFIAKLSFKVCVRFIFVFGHCGSKKL